MRLARVGLENVVGCIDIESWPFGLTKLVQIDVADLNERLQDVQVLDVRRRGEYADGHVPDALNVPLSDLPTNPGTIIKIPRPAN